MNELTLELPLPPSANHRYVRRRGGQLALTREARDYDAYVWAALGRDRPAFPSAPRSRSPSASSSITAAAGTSTMSSSNSWIASGAA
jgi:hypothetical protein